MNVSRSTFIVLFLQSRLDSLATQFQVYEVVNPLLAFCNTRLGRVQLTNLGRHVLGQRGGKGYEAAIMNVQCSLVLLCTIYQDRVVVYKKHCHFHL